MAVRFTGEDGHTTTFSFAALPLPGWHADLARLDQALSDRALAPYLRHWLRQQRDDITRFLEASGGA